MVSGALGQPSAEEREYEQWQGREAEQPAPAEVRHDENGEQYLEARAYGPEQVGQYDAACALLLWQELGVECDRLRRSADAEADKAAQYQQPGEHGRQCRQRTEVERKYCAQY